MITALILSVVIPMLILTCLPRIILHYGGEPKRYMLLLYIACVLYIVSWWLPSPLIEGKDTSFTTHFLGGGVFTGLLWLYVKQSLDMHAKWYIEAFSLFALVSALGVANELFEVVLYLLGGMPHGISDTSWDLLANTLGALLFYAFYTVSKRSSKKLN